MGEQLREGAWDPATDATPADILGMVAYAASKGVQLLAYAYPCLKFEAQASSWVGASLSLAPAAVQDWWIVTMNAFLAGSGAGGFAWDHNIYSGDKALQYQEWRGWMRILAAVRAAHPDMVMDHRQTAHLWGPWYQLAGSYSEPIAGDENPETYGVPIASLHTDHVAADNTRIVNHRYAVEQLLPPSRVPGFIFHQVRKFLATEYSCFLILICLLTTYSRLLSTLAPLLFIFHQTERTGDNGTMPCNHDAPCYGVNTRDFDLLGYKYVARSQLFSCFRVLLLTRTKPLKSFHSHYLLLSTIGTGTGCSPPSAPRARTTSSR